LSLLTLLHGAVIGACVLLALTHILLAIRSSNTQQRAVNLSVAVLAVAAGAATWFELQKSLATDSDDFLAGLFGEVVAAFVLLMALLFFIRTYFDRKADRLFFLATSVWVGSHIYQIFWFPKSFFSYTGDLFFRSTFWGEQYAKLDATVSAYKYFTDLGSLLVLAYIITATVTSARRDDTRSALIVGGGATGFMLLAGILVPLDDAGVLSNTMPIGLPFLAIVAALTYQLIEDRSRMNAFRLEIEQLRRNSLAGEIAAGLMHELRQPLTSILSNAQAARRFLDFTPPDLDEVREALEDVVSEDKRAAEIIGGLRNFLVQEAPETTEFDVNLTTRRASRMLAGEFNTNDTRLTVNLHAAALNIHASEIQVEQVIINLAMNALHALRNVAPGSRIVRISTRAVVDGAELRVADSGPGIAPDERSRIFEPFTSGSDGLGMGLAICKRIVDSHNGTIHVEDDELGGASFVVVLPLGQPRED
jgi:signal transduction histidine kinase